MIHKNVIHLIFDPYTTLILRISKIARAENTDLKYFQSASNLTPT